MFVELGVGESRDLAFPRNESRDSTSLAHGLTSLGTCVRLLYCGESRDSTLLIEAFVRAELLYRSAGPRGGCSTLQEVVLLVEMNSHKC